LKGTFDSDFFLKIKINFFCGIDRTFGVILKIFFGFIKPLILETSQTKFGA
jgi:hypothetical protein